MPYCIGNAGKKSLEIIQLAQEYRKTRLSKMVVA